jgi:pimeloyl-ACP methyl ester carboxylesterase
MEDREKGTAKPLFPKRAMLGNGITLEYLEQGDPDGVPLVLLPGIADSCHVFDLLLPHLQDDLHVFALSPRGHGDSVKPQAGYRTGDFAMDLIQFLDALGLAEAVIVGASSGGFVARHFAASWPERTAGIVLVGTPSLLADKPQVQKAWNEVISKLEDPVDPAFVRGFAKEETIGRVPLEFREMMVAENLKVPARVWMQTTEGLLEETFPSDLERVRCPALLLWGDRETITTKTEQESVSAKIRGSRLVVLEGLGHMLYWEDPERVAKEIGAFVRRILK